MENFGDNHMSLKLVASNAISVPNAYKPTPESIAKALIDGDFVTSNGPTGIDYHNGSGRTDFDTWLEKLRTKPNFKGRILAGARSEEKAEAAPNKKPKQ